MKRLAVNFILGICLFSWFFLIALNSIYFFPKNVVQAADRYFLTSHSLDYKNLTNTGNLLNPILQFDDLRVIEEQEVLVNASKLTLGINLFPSIFLKKIILSKLSISDGKINYKSSDSDRGSVIRLAVGENLSFSFTNFLFIRDGSPIKINGSINGSRSKSLAAQLSFLHENNLSTIAVNSTDHSYSFAANLHAYKWLGLIPGISSSRIKDLNLGLNAVGSIGSDQSIIQGSLRYEGLNLGSLAIKGNQGSFKFQSMNHYATLKLNQFINPFLDEQFPIQINLKQKSIVAPKIYITNDVLELNNSQLSNLAIENLFLSFKKSFFQSSGLIKDLDISNIYFKEILNLTGRFSGTGNSFRFQINSPSAFLVNYDGQNVPAAIVGDGNFSELGLALKAKIKSNSSYVNFNLGIQPSSQHPISITLKGQDVSQELIRTTFPASFSGVNNFISSNIIPSKKNTLYLKYLSPGNETKPQFKAKILLQESQAKLNTDLTINFLTALVEVGKDNLYVYSPSGNISNLPSNSIFGALNFTTQNLQFSSSHSLSSEILSGSSVNLAETFKSFNAYAAHKGQINLASKKLNNAISIKTEKFNLLLLKNLDMKFDQGNIFIVNLDSLFGSMPANLLKKDISISLHGKDLIKKYSLNFFSKIQLELENYLPQSSYFNLEGKEFFDLNLSVDHKSEPELNIFSNLERTSIASPLNFLKKKDSLSIPTTIKVYNFSNPSIKVTNQMVDLEIRGMEEPQGYISLGGALPARLSHFKKISGLNFYVNAPSFNTKELNAISFKPNGNGSIRINKLAFDIESAEIFDNLISNVSGLFSFKKSEISGDMTGKNLNARFIRDKTGFMKITLNNSTLRNLNLNFGGESKIKSNINSRLVVKNSLLGGVKIKDLDVYFLKNNDVLTLNNIRLQSNLMSINPTAGSNNAYFSMNTSKPLYKIKGDFLIKDSMKIPFVRDIADFSYFNGTLNLQWKNLSTLSNIEGETSFILKDLTVQNSLSNSLAFNLLGVLNLKNIIGKIANLDLSIDEYTSTKLSRVEANMLFNKSKLRLTAPLFVETNTAKMKWVGQINKDYKNSLNELDLNLDLRIRVGENLPWYAAILGGLPAVAGSAVINKVFEEDINDLSNYQYEILGTISQPELRRIK